MRIQETCSCGGSLVLLPQVSTRQRPEEIAEEIAEAIADAWLQVDRWRELHAGCRERFQPTVIGMDVSATSPFADAFKDTETP